jgi:hypothetical protein
MSYDVQIWTVRKIELETVLPERENWHGKGKSWVYSGRNWQLVLSGFDRVLFEDVPTEVSRLLPGIAFLVTANLEGDFSVAAAQKLLRRASAMIAKSAHGVILDPQADSTETPSGIKRFIPAPRENRFSILEMSWWFTKGPLLSTEGKDLMLSCLEKHLPEALPKRYGGYEPPQYHYAAAGRQHFLEFLSSSSGVVVWYPAKPVVDVTFSIAKSSGPTRLGFRCHRLIIAIDVAVLGQPGWQLGLKNFWMSMSKVINPFFGDVRTLRDMVRSGGTFAVARDSEQHPVVSWWWKGIPKTCGHAAVLGEPYLTLWPEFNKHAHHNDNLAFLSNDSWIEPDEVSSRIGGVPDALVQQLQPVESALPTAPRPKKIYPQIWPFGEPYSDAAL